MAKSINIDPWDMLSNFCCQTRTQTHWTWICFIAVTEIELIANSGYSRGKQKQQPLLCPRSAPVHCPCTIQYSQGYAI